MLVPVQVSGYVTEPDVVGVTAWDPVAASLPLQAPLAVQEAAWVLDHVRVADWPAVIDVGLTDRVTVGAGAGGALDPLPPQASSARPMRAAAATGQSSRIRKLVRMGDMLPRPSGVLRRKRPNTIPGGRSPKYGIVWGTLVPRVNSHTARLGPRGFYSVTGRLLLLKPGAGDPLALVELAQKTLCRGPTYECPPYVHRAVLIDADRLGQAPHRDAQIAPIAQAARIRVVPQRPCHEALLLGYLEGLPTTAAPNFPARALAELRQRLA